jgi:hypothetical protein
MEINQYLELFTRYQISSTILALTILASLIGGLFLYYTNDFKTTIISFLSVLFVPILTGITLILLYNFSSIEPSEKHTLILWFALFINIINLSTLGAKYANEILKKDFDIDHITRYHFSATLNLFVTILLLGGASAVFVELNMLIILIGNIFVSSATIWLNHLIARLLLKDK